MVVTVRRTSPAAWDFSRGYQCPYLCCPFALKPVGVSCNHGHCIMMTYFRHCLWLLFHSLVKILYNIYINVWWLLVPFFFFILTQICQGTIFVVPVISTSLFILDSAVFGALSHLFVMMVFFSLFIPAPCSPQSTFTDCYTCLDGIAWLWPRLLKDLRLNLFMQASVGLDPDILFVCWRFLLQHCTCCLSGKHPLFLHVFLDCFSPLSCSLIYVPFLVVFQFHLLLFCLSHLPGIFRFIQTQLVDFIQYSPLHFAVELQIIWVSHLHFCSLPASWGDGGGVVVYKATFV